MAGRKSTRDKDNLNEVVTMSFEEHSSAIARLNGMEFHLHQLRQREYCDLTLRAVTGVSGSDALRESEPLYGHRIILEAASPFFAKLFASGLLNQDNFAVPGIKRSTLDFLLNCIYNCDVGILDEQNMFQICAGAKLLNLSSVQTACEKFIQSTRNINNALQIWSFGRKEQCENLFDPTYILEHFEEVTKTPYFTRLTNDEVQALFSPSALHNVHLSDENLLSLHKWVRGSGDAETIKNRIELFISVLKKFPPEKLDEKVFAIVFLDDEILKGHPDWQKFKSDYLCHFFRKHIDGQATSKGSTTTTSTTPQKSKAAERPSAVVTVKTNGQNGDESISNGTSKSTRRSRPSSDTNSDELFVPKRLKEETVVSSGPGRPKKSISLGGLIPLANGQGHCIAFYIVKRGDHWRIDSYDFQTGVVQKLCDFLRPYRENGVLMKANHRIYYLGGKTIGDEEESNCIDVFDLNSKEWQSEDLLALDEGRCYFNCAVLNDQIYIVAGFRAESCIDSVERIPLAQQNGESTDGEEVTNVRWPKNRSPLGVIDGKIYSVGGAVAEGNENAWASAFVECYDAKSNKWSEVARMPTARVGHAVTVLDSKLYALGGAGSEMAKSSHRFTTVELYDPKWDTWTSLAPMLKKRQYGSAVAYDGFVYAVGGDSIRNSTIERYHPKTDTWEMVGTLNLPRETDYSTMVYQIEASKATN